MALQVVTFPVMPIVRTHLIVNCVITFLALVVVALRLVSRFITNAKLWWDDYFVLMAVPMGIGMLVIQGLYMPMGVGLHITETVANLPVILKLMVAYALIYTGCISILKLSVLFFYLRVFLNPGMQLATKIALGVVSAWTIANILMLFLMCRPFASNYDLTVKGECADQPTIFIAIGAFNIITDVVILVLPLPTIWGLKAAKQKKIGLTVIFLFGLVVCAIAAGRITSLEILKLDNITETMVWVDFLSTTEINVAILCVSLPMLGPFVARYITHHGASKLGRSPDENRYYQQSGSKQTGSRFSKKKPDPDTIGLDSIYAHNMETQHDTTVSAAKDRAEVSSLHDSESSLNPGPRLSGSQGQGGTIIVHKKWEISSS